MSTPIPYINDKAATLSAQAEVGTYYFLNSCGEVETLSFHKLFRLHIDFVEAPMPCEF